MKLDRETVKRRDNFEYNRFDMVITWDGKKYRAESTNYLGCEITTWDEDKYAAYSRVLHAIDEYYDRQDIR